MSPADKIKLAELSEMVRHEVQRDPSQGRSKFLKMLYTEFPNLPFQVVFLDLIPCDPLSFNCVTPVVLMSIDYRDAGRYVVLNARCS